MLKNTALYHKLSSSLPLKQWTIIYSNHIQYIIVLISVDNCTPNHKPIHDNSSEVDVGLSIGLKFGAHKLITSSDDGIW